MIDSQISLSHFPLARRQNPCALRATRRWAKGPGHNRKGFIMKSKLQERAIQAAAKFVAHRGYEVLDTEWAPEDGIKLDLVALDDDAVVFFDVYAREGINKGLPNEETEGTRQRMELAAAKWLAEHIDDERLVDTPVRFDIVSMLVIGEDRALLRHHINALGSSRFADTAD